MRAARFIDFRFKRAKESTLNWKTAALAEGRVNIYMTNKQQEKMLGVTGH